MKTECFKISVFNIDEKWKGCGRRRIRQRGEVQWVYNSYTSSIMSKFPKKKIMNEIIN